MAKMAKAKRVLRFIGRSGTNGRSFTEIQEFVLRMNNIIGPKESRPRHLRGYWCDYLLGDSDNDRVGFLRERCFKNMIDRWIMIDPLDVEGPYSPQRL